MSDDTTETWAELKVALVELSAALNELRRSLPFYWRLVFGSLIFMKVVHLGIDLALPFAR